MSDTFEPKVLALAAHLGVEPDTISECLHGDNMYECSEEPGEYMVCTDSEADSAADERLESYIDECILPETPEPLRNYFDRESWKRDELMWNDRGHTLASYDGAEEEEQIDGEWFFIYRMH